MNSDEKENKIYEEWRERQRKQISNVTSIYLALTTAILGFVVNFISINKLQILCKTYLKIGAILLVVSILFALLLTLNRLIDFRKTAQLYKQGKSSDDVAKQTYLKGKISWLLLYLQLIFFGFGMSILIITFSQIL